MSRAKLAGLLVATGVVVGSVVGVAASVTGASICGAGDEGTHCYELTRTLAVRVGIVAGLMAVLMVLVVAGLLRMLSQDDKDRAERAMEAYLASGDRASEGGES